MKDELKKIRPVLDKMGPLIRQTDPEDDAEDCNVSDAFQSSDCLDDVAPENNNTQISASTSDDEQITTKPSGIPIFHVDANKFPQVGARNKIHGLPTLVLFLKGMEVWRFEGVMSGEDILKSISDELGRMDDVTNISHDAAANEINTLREKQS